MAATPETERQAEVRTTAKTETQTTAQAETEARTTAEAEAKGQGGSQAENVRRRFARDARLALRSDRARRLVLISPALFSVVVRWLAWLQALLFLRFAELPEVNRRHEPWLLLLTFAILALYTLYVPVLRSALRPIVQHSRLAALVDQGGLLAALDVLTSLVILWLSGGAHSPYLRFGITATILPALRFGYRGGLLAAAGYSLGYLLVVSTAGDGLDGILARHELDMVIGSALDPFLVALFVAYLSHVLRGLRAEQTTTDRALRETAALYGLACAVLPTPDPRTHTAAAAGPDEPDTVRFVARAVEAVRAARLYRVFTVDVLAGDPDERAIQAGFGLRARPGEWALDLPLSVAGSRAGTVRFAGLGPGATPATAARLAGAVVRQIEIGLEHARLYRERARLVAQEERGRMGREIHDGIAQALYMLTLSLEACVELAGRPGAEAELAPRLAQLLTLSKQALWEVRHYIYDLKPMLSGDYSLTSTLQNQVKEFRTISGLATELQIEGEEPEVPVPVRAALYRIVQEALANVFKHARATRVEIAVHYDPARIRLAVADDGVGLPDAAPAGFGLGNMQTRAREVGGSLTLANQPAGGLRLQADLPLSEVQ